MYVAVDELTAWTQWMLMSEDARYQPVDARVELNRGFTPREPVCDSPWVTAVVEHLVGRYRLEAVVKRSKGVEGR